MLPLFLTFASHENIACSPSEFNPAIHKATYRYNYPAMFKAFESMHDDDIRATLRDVIKKDRFFIAYFVAGWEDGKSSGNKPFVVNMCRMLDDGENSGTVDVWSREHGKSSCITIAGTVQRVVNDPECTTAIFSFRKSAADKFLDSIRKIFELDFMVWCFPDIFETNTEKYPIWSLQGGIRVKRTNTVRRENTVEAFGLVEGAPIGGHFDHRIYDDIETDVMARNPEQLDQCFESLLMSRALGREGGTELIIGTYYSHCGVLVKLGEKKNVHGNLMYKLRLFPATDDGTINGKPVFFSQEYLDDKKTDSGFNTQYLCNPTPTSEIKLDFNRFKAIPRRELPKDRIKFVIIDPAGDKEVQSGSGNDSWAMLCVSVRPYLDELGNSDVFIEDGIVSEMGLSAAIDAACNLYVRNGRIALLGIEKVANDTTYRHIQNALTARGRYLEIKKKGQYGGNLLLLSPSGRSKNYRIETALAWPINNSKLHYVDDLDVDLVASLREECNKFPFFHVDMLDALAYIYDILADPTSMFAFGLESDEDEDYQEEIEEQGRCSVTGY